MKIYCYYVEKYLILLSLKLYISYYFNILNKNGQLKIKDIFFQHKIQLFFNIFNKMNTIA